MSEENSACVLVVDDDPDLCQTFQILLQLHGYSVATSSDGADALARLRTGLSPCIILLDLMMPGMNGVQFREEQLRDPALREIPVVVVTGQHKAENRAGALGLEVLRKPPELHTLLDRVSRFCSHSGGRSYDPSASLPSGSRPWPSRRRCTAGSRRSR